ncbi:DUF4352 domain-containing protein [Paenibacillus sp. FSL M7-1455]|uniref:DUF4352 domain-containing protein n=1 Tax=Paenibacillus sp. FSL M7-1455 TaxID=2975316 RepID=UPI0030F7B1A7
MDKARNSSLIYILGIVGVCLIVMIISMIFGLGKGDNGSSDQYVDARDLTPKIGDSVSVGPFSVKIAEVARDGDTVTLNVVASNASNKAADLYSDQFKIRDDSGNEYTSQTLATNFVNVNPGIDKTEKISFNIPAAAENLSLNIAEGLFSSKYKTVDLGQNTKQ